MNITSEKSPDANIKISNFRRALPQILAVSVKNVLLLGFGMTLGFPTILIPSLSGDNPDETIALDQDAISWIGSVNLLCVPLGCLLSGIITQPLGRKRSMQFVNLPFLAAWLLFYYSKESWQVFLALCMTGVSGGLLEAPVLTFIAEITEPNMRGALSSTSTLSVNLGVFISFLLGSFLNWRTMALVNTSVPVLAFVLFAFIPESPYWLVSKNKQREAKKSLAWLRGWTHTDNVTEEYLEIVDSLEKTPMTTKSKGKEFVKQQVKMYCKSNFLKPFFLIMLAFYIGHFGNSSITVYAINIFNAFQVPINSYYATIYIGLVQLVGVTICTFCIRYIGKRKLTFISLAGVALSFLASGIYSYIFDVTNFTNHPRSSQQAYTWIPLLTLLAQAFFAYLGIKQLPWNLLGEVFNNDVRAMASGISAAGAYIIHFIANKIFLDLMEVVTLPGIFWIYSVTACLGAVALYFLLPETEGKSLAEIIDHYNGKAKLNNKIGRRRRNVCAEVTTPNLRGVLASTSTVAVISGVLIQFLLGTFLHWRSVALVSSMLPIVACVLLFFVPESPYWLVSKNRLEDAQKSIAWLRGWLNVADVEQEYKDFYEQLKKNSIQQDASEDRKKTMGSKLKRMKKNLSLYTKKNFLWPFGLVTLAFGLGHFSGMTTLQTYAVNVFATLKAPINKYYATIILGIAEALGCILSSTLVHFVGKRKMNFFSLVGTGLCFLVVATYAQVIDVKYLKTLELHRKEDIGLDGQSWVPMTFLVGAAFFSHTGIRILPWMLIGEVYYSEIRATASGFSGAASYILGFISNKMFFSMISLFTLPGTFWFYSSVCLLGFIALYFWLPETEGKTLFQITEHFGGGDKLNNKVTNFVNTRKMKKKIDNKKAEVNEAFDHERAKSNGDIDIRL